MNEQDEKKKKHQRFSGTQLDASEREELEELGIFFDEDEIQD